jgi:HD-GYP domain-containing protein (c-di-GMP phosphodiesterase class II)
MPSSAGKALLSSVTIDQAVRIALNRPPPERYGPLPIRKADGSFALIDLRTLLLAQTRLLESAATIVAKQGELARSLGVPESEYTMMRRGALLHDIGKMGVPDAALLKPGALSAEERAIMARHPGFAQAILSRIAFLGYAVDIAYCHHERWDGSGYPRGLESQEIPLSARIFAIVDVWDALRSYRPYRSAMSEEQASAIIAEGSGSHFDPRVAKHFFQIIGSSAARKE